MSIMTEEQIKKVALEHGFSERRQPDGSFDLNPYVYTFAQNLMEAALEATRPVNGDTDPEKPILSLDFDGVLHQYTSGWHGAMVIKDDPVEGAMRFLTDATEKFNVHIYSTRSNADGGIQAMYTWLRNHLYQYWDSMPEVASKVLRRLSFPVTKPKAMVYLDDRAQQFTGQWPEVDELLEFTPWNK